MTRPACSVAGCVDTAEVRVSMAYAETTYLCATHGHRVRSAILETLGRVPPQAWARPDPTRAAP
jgi:hypothetical protein